MRAQLRSLSTVDEEPLEDYAPESRTDFAIGLRAVIGPSDGPGDELFDILVCSPSWLEANQLDKGFRWGHGVLLIARWDVDLVRRAVGDLVTHAEGETWDMIGQTLSRYAHWEFADYRALEPRVVVEE